MKRLLFILLVFFSLGVFAQTSPVLNLRIQNRSTAFGQDLPIGTRIFVASDSTRWVVIDGVLSSQTITSAIAKLDIDKAIIKVTAPITVTKVEKVNTIGIVDASETVKGSMSVADKIKLNAITNVVASVDGVANNNGNVDLKSTDGSVTITASDANNYIDFSVTKTTIGLGNLDNTSDANKPVSTAQLDSINLRVRKSSLAGTTNYLQKTTGTGKIGNSLIYDDGTNVGIGTTTPSYPLDVNGAINSTLYRLGATELKLDAFKSGEQGAAGTILQSAGASSSATWKTVNQAIGGDALSSGYLPYWDGSKLVNSPLFKSSDNSMEFKAIANGYFDLAVQRVGQTSNLSSFGITSRPDTYFGTTYGAFGFLGTLVDSDGNINGYVLPMFVNPNGDVWINKGTNTVAGSVGIGTLAGTGTGLVTASSTGLLGRSTAADFGLAPIASPTFTGKVTTPDLQFTDSKFAHEGYVLKTTADGGLYTEALSASQVYKGTWNATTNSPTLADGTGTAGWYYRVATAGTVDLGSGNITFAVGDDVSYNGSIWQKIPGQGYTLQTATASVLGGVKIGTTIDISDGVINANNVTGVVARANGGTGLNTITQDNIIVGGSGGGFYVEKTPSQYKTILGLNNVTNNAQIYSLGGLTAQTQTFSTGTSGTAPNWSSATSTHTINIPQATTLGVTAGLLSYNEYVAKVTGNSAITAGTYTKITYDAKGLVTGGANATTADIAASTNKNYVTDAQLTVIGNTSGTNSGNQTLTIGGTTSPTIALSGSNTATFSAGTGITLGQSGGTITITGTAEGAIFKVQTFTEPSTSSGGGYSHVLTYTPKNSTGILVSMNGTELDATQYTYNSGAKTITVGLPVYQYDKITVSYTY